jgi:bacterioferritin (cytochrome b1)
MFTEYSVGFIPKHTLHFGMELRNCIENDKAIETVKCILRCCKFIINSFKLDDIERDMFDRILVDTEGYDEYMQTNNEADEEYFESVNLVLEEFYDACDYSKIRIV